MSEQLLIRSGRILDPGRRIDMTGDVLVDDGRIAEVAPSIAAAGARVFDARGLVVTPGFVDIHTHLRDPGYEYKETIATGTLAAARGGFTTVCCMPNTNPPLDSAATVEYVLRTAASASARVLPIGCVSRGRAGKELAELGDLRAAGCVGFSDDGAPVADGSLMRRALEYASAFGLPVIQHAEDPELAHDGVMHEGWVAARLGLRGQPAAAEEAMVARDLALAAELGARLHVAHISTAGAVRMVREAKARGVAVTAEVTPHHLALTHEAVAFSGDRIHGLSYNTNAKVNPPLRTQEDAEACLAGLLDGTIDAIATDHAPHAAIEKACEFDDAAFGISGLETALALCLTLVHRGAIDLPTLIERLTAGPVRTLDLARWVPGIGSLAPGAPADVTVFDLDAEWTVDPAAFASKGRNTPLAGRTLRGRVVLTVAGGRTVHEYGAVGA